ncbi:MAG: tyrosine-type recombinase/integrase [Candidatus Thermoplasmatota archaeon]|nr:tyrosine-type recombinase/integrase [Candidatus Thermoplasmatota archaeon]MBU1941894.1 tyrosine-type recombinase/integrase [Candidatus Thermoplasmatota archaeon]
MTWKHYDVEKAIANIDNITTSGTNKHMIKQFNEFQAAQGLSKARQVKYLYILSKITRMLDKEYTDATKQDMIKLASEINNSSYADWTKHDYLVILKRFMKWVKEEQGQEFERRQYPKEVSWIIPKKQNGRHELPKQLITMDDAKELANNTNNLRDRCLVLLLYETGARIGELIDLKIKDVDFDQYGAHLTLFGKTGARKIRIIASAPAISNWLLEHPDKNNKESFLLCGLWQPQRGKKLEYRHINRLLKETGEKAAISKPMNPHHFRHSRATELALQLTESQLCAYMGWVQGSTQAATYVHLSGKDVDNAILSMYGLIDKDEKREKFKPIDCPRCKTRNDPAAKFCSQCSLGLDEKNMIEFDKQKNEAQKLGFNLQLMYENKEFMMQMMNVMATEWAKKQQKDIKK